MIESSVIKLILIVALNMCFVWVWVKKENLRRTMPFRIIRRLEEKDFLKNCEKTKKVISFIGNINMFWIINILYLFVVKFFEEILNMTLNFPYGLKYIEKSIETSFFKVDYLGIKTLDEITKFVFDSGNFIGLFIGVTALMIPIYLYIIGFKSKSKRQLLLMLTKKGDMFYISFFIYIMLFFKIEKIFLVGAIGYLIFLLMEAVKWIMKIENSLYSFEGLNNVLKLQEEEEIVELYNATLNELYQGVKDNDVSLTSDNKDLLVRMLENDKSNVQIDSKKLVKFLYDVYDIAIKNQDDDIFRKISYLHIRIAQYYLRKNDSENFYWALCGMVKVYDYHYKNGSDKFKWNVISGFDYWEILENYKENLKSGVMWYAQIFKTIMKGIKKAVANNDFYFFKEFIYLIEEEFKYRGEIERDYKLLERSVKFGILLYLKEEKRKRRNDRSQYKKTDEFIEFIEKIILNNKELVDLIELYVFINERIIYDRSLLNWEEYFEPKMELVGVTSWDNRLGIEKNKLFLELLGKLKYMDYDEEALYDKERLKDCLEIGSDFEERIKIDFEKSFERINEFKEKSNSLLVDLEKLGERIELSEEKRKKIKDLLTKMRNDFKLKKSEKIKKEPLSEEKYKIFREEVKKKLEDSEIIKIFNRLKKYKKINKKNDEILKIGVNQCLNKEYFIKLGKKDEKTFIDMRDVKSENFGKSLNVEEEKIKDLARSRGKVLNDGIKKIIVENLENNAILAEDLNTAINKISGDPMIVIIGMGELYTQYKSNKNILFKHELEEKDYDKYGKILESLYKGEKKEAPIYKFRAIKSKKTGKYISGIYIFDSNEIENFYHYLSGDDEIESDFEDEVSYANLKLIDTKNLSEEKKEEILSKNEITEEELYQYVWIMLSQKGELKFKENAVVYKVEFNG